MRMSGLGSTIGNLARYRRQPEALLARAQAAGASTALAEISGFGPNPGNLRMLAHIPAGLPRSSPLVVLLHGCTQTARSYATGTGWTTLADRYGFALLLPEQRTGNNPNACFNW